MRFRHLLFATLLLLTTSSFGQCNSGDCQQGAIAGPYTAPQVAEFSSSNAFTICKSYACTHRTWVNGQIEGIDAQQHIGSQYQFYDTAPNIDENIAVGPTVSGQNAQILEWVNFSYVQAFDKVTGEAIFTFAGGKTAVPQNVASLWSSTSQPECRGSSGNVQVIFDRLDNEFVISRHTTFQVNGISHYAWCVAVSSASDLTNPKTQWYAYEYKMDSVLPCIPSSNNCTTGNTYYYFPDWPRVASWSNGFYITFDLTDPTAGYLQTGFEACQLDRAHIANGQPSNPMKCYTYMVPTAQEPSLIHSVDVADVDSALSPGSAEPEYFLAIVNPSNAQQGGNGQNWCTSNTTPCTSNQLAFFTWGSSGLSAPTFLNVNSYTPGCYNTSAPGRQEVTACVPEPSTATQDVGGYGQPTCGDYSTPCVDSLGDRMANRLAYNNLSSKNGPNGEYLITAHVVMEDSTNQRTGIRYYILQINNGNASVLVNSGGNSGPPDLQDPKNSLFYFMPSAALDQHGNLGITYTTSGMFCSQCQTQPHPALNFDILRWKSTSFNPPIPIIQGAGDEENNTHWGEYAATVIDPTDNLTFFGVGQYYNTNQTGTTNCNQPKQNCFTWQTRIFRQEY